MAKKSFLVSWNLQERWHETCALPDDLAWQSAVLRQPHTAAGNQSETLLKKTQGILLSGYGRGVSVAILFSDQYVK